MRTIGLGTSALLAVVAVGAAIVGVRSYPDFQRYLRIRSM